MFHCRTFNKFFHNVIFLFTANIIFVKQFFMKTIAAVIILILFSMEIKSQEVLILAENETPGTGSLTEVSWLIGYWKGTGLGGDCEELWMPAVDNAMNGIFRFNKDGQIQFTEYMVLEESAGTITLKLKHFSRDLTPWEDKERWVSFPLVKLENDTAFFHGITFARNSDTLKIFLTIKGKDGSRIEEFSFIKTLL